jgi:hypothetical protein
MRASAAITYMPSISGERWEMLIVGNVVMRACLREFANDSRELPALRGNIHAAYGVRLACVQIDAADLRLAQRCFAPASRDD